MFTLFLGLLVLSGCSKGVTAGNYTLYSTKISKVSVNSDNEWEIKGTTDAPDGTKIIATPSKHANDYYRENIGTDDDGDVAYADDGEFTVNVDPFEVSPNDGEKANEKVKIQIFAIEKYHEKQDATLPKKVVDTAKEKFGAKTLKVTSKQAKQNIADFEEDDEDTDTEDKDPEENTDTENEETEDEDTEETDADDEDTDADDTTVLDSVISKASKNVSDYQTGITYDQIARTPDDYKNKKIQFSGEVAQVLEDDGMTGIRLAVNGDYDNMILVHIRDNILKGSRVLENDQVTISGLSIGTTTYESTMGQDITIPAMVAVIVNNSSAQ